MKREDLIPGAILFAVEGSLPVSGGAFPFQQNERIYVLCGPYLVSDLLEEVVLLKQGNHDAMALVSEVERCCSLFIQGGRMARRWSGARSTPLFPEPEPKRITFWEHLLREQEDE